MYNLIIYNVKGAKMNYKSNEGTTSKTNKQTQTTKDVHKWIPKML